MNADDLRRAAQKLRETAATATPGPWEHVSTGDDGPFPLWVIGPPTDPDNGWTSREVVRLTEDMTDALKDVADPEEIVARADLDWIALASPSLAEPIAAWLDRVAQWWPTYGSGDREAAIAVARAILGEGVMTTQTVSSPTRSDRCGGAP